MPPDYSKKGDESEKSKQMKSRLEALEDSVYSPRFKENRQNDAPIRSVPFAVRRDWNQEEEKKESVPETVSSRNTYAILKQILIGSVVLFFASLGVAAYVFWGGSNIISTKNILISLNTPSSVAGGEKLPVEISIINQNNVALLTAEVLVEYGDGGREPEDLSKELRRYREAIGPIEINGNINKKYEVVFFGEEGESKEIKVTLEYRVKGSNAIFKKTETQLVSLSSAPVSVSVESAKEISVGDEAVFTVKLSANTSEILNNPMITADFPFGFQFTSADPRPVYGNNVWDLGDLQPGSSRTITIRGKFGGTAGEERSMRFIVGSKDPRDARKIGVIFLAKTFTVTLSRPNIALDLSLAGKRDMEVSVKAGNDIRTDVIFTNNLDTKISNIVVEVRPRGTIFDRNSVSVTGGFYRSIDGTVVWDQSTAKSLEELGPGESGSLTFSFSTLRSAIGGRTPTMTVEATITGNKMSEGEIGQIRSTVTKTVKIASEMSASAKILYSTGPFSNTGPVPPIAEQETTYTVMLGVTNSTNDLSDVQVVTSLPIYATWLNKISPEFEVLKYNPAGGGIVWDVNDLGAGETREVYFQVSFLPSINQIGFSPDLIKEVRASGYDSFTGTTLQVSPSERNYDIRLVDDSAYSSKGGPVKRN
ncbi:MAG: hypothetical protein A3H57_02385 [Candidatus Taylorbacteria bacterium RIFCSPLOWO2_02_FULL_43_11]|uniref:DUF11 domain-containing protein n=1 Tax=Candidatus Taylorbacteria bacterium RIFCSPHIGHO2_02_FULL_43_32b TaxID=1802306 RepID=A0A1G2MFW9_9BACT|nr:MAG: hypothetical protein A2743_00145 [Candidatus Taylorbacteria bacterium RIFCSPHIGHO2_01_FULL_43_47]OHA22777.1 MAG: hypothetical protein A3C72_02585 [Candidatus Taylorbacteria bacterium RIFCSPHIGHO2_02_FULL_43_32b]OHA30833.1 MAG: hypothetical protein A3B08_01400 [Candidatus Taylorbacteria bacterium RIFCSPLOWO2_01_FULL_43_44]OHA35229.1 MAG: hypothetical protein A3H57_02385 [Candidatus Taylorbacteria bacterium RIFCSPLOWO2_02_FULL_43_11]